MLIEFLRLEELSREYNLYYLLNEYMDSPEQMLTREDKK